MGNSQFLFTVSGIDFDFCLLEKETDFGENVPARYDCRDSCLCLRVFWVESSCFVCEKSGHGWAFYRQPGNVSLALMKSQEDEGRNSDGLLFKMRKRIGTKRFYLSCVRRKNRPCALIRSGGEM